MKSKNNIVESGQDISGQCIRCGSTEVFQKETVKVEYAPFWATYLRATGVLKFIYNRLVQRGVLQIGLWYPSIGMCCFRYRGVGK